MPGCRNRCGWKARRRRRSKPAMPGSFIREIIWRGQVGNTNHFRLGPRNQRLGARPDRPASYQAMTSLPCRRGVRVSRMQPFGPACRAPWKTCPAHPNR
ncbi:hypothetical protein CBM2589_B60043 [Cupriavidus taiwanensis]|uniref:Uncharacterized protein n=1 Tax=Cupriavidus taiwanensis TaxID=164546 RepID=A0A375BWX0_9BURK|nr:hypothetical protein CBM2589_B60043 [Cupriavidus taiwanensis]